MRTVVPRVGLLAAIRVIFAVPGPVAVPGSLDLVAGLVGEVGLGQLGGLDLEVNLTGELTSHPAPALDLVAGLVGDVVPVNASAFDLALTAGVSAIVVPV